jgi:lipopolysaccharide/colanic/teichoic acid biosynthesis glycosyltransferase
VAREVEAAVWRALRADLGQGRLPLELALTAGRVLGQGLAHRLLGCVGAEDAGTAPALLVEAALLAAPAAATPRVQQMLGDRDRPAAQRAEIATGVGRSGREELCPALLECAGDPDLQDAALEALEQIGPGAGEALASLLGRGDRPLQARAAAAIARVGDARAAGALLDALESATGEAAEALLRAAGELLAPIGDEGGLGGLVALSAPGGFYARFGKRAVDIAVAVVALPLMLTPMVIGALLVKASSRGPVFSRSRRVGRGGEEFTLLKLRTLRPEWEARARVGPVLAERDDPRVTVPGRWLRATSIDEFPQVLNILRGEMSWVGPRAHALWLAREFRAAVPLYDKRSLVRPGMTGLGQLYGLAASEGADQRVELREDLRYVRHLSLALDATIHLRSVAPALRSLLEP